MGNDSRQRAGPKNYAVVIGPRGPTERPTSVVSQGRATATPKPVSLSCSQRLPTVTTSNTEQNNQQRFEDHYVDNWLRQPPLLFRTLARLVCLLLVFQPVYMAFGMELSEEGVVSDTTSESSEIVVNESEIAEPEIDEEVPSAVEGEVEATHLEATEETNVELDEQSSSDPVEIEDEFEEPATESDGQPEEAEELDEQNEDEAEILGVATSSEAKSGDVVSEPATTTATTTGTSTDETTETEVVTGGGSSGNSDGQNDSGATTTTATTTASSTATSTSEGMATTTEPTIASGETDGQPATTTSSVVDPATGQLTFGEQECMVLKDGAFYCATAGADISTSEPVGLGSVVSRIDSTGDREIYLVEQGRTTQLTFNDYDDMAPIYDGSTLRVVWQAMINDRLQIMFHDRTTGKTTQLTNTSYNNSDPHVFGDILVWQAWVDNNWEIFMATDLHRNVPTVRQLTDNTAHDMFPKVFGALVTWQAQTRDSWHVVVYDTENKHYSYVKKRGDGRYENPRFVLVFDNRDEDGDVEVVGYDVATDEEVPLAPVEQSTPDPVSPVDDTGSALPASSATSSIAYKSDRKDSKEDD